ncbi:MAG: site-specific DNA-methyltransferase [Treponema sp.]|jgi:site-specific DNA-methyltransferase (adenine-specific)|nr:site-specific DNA-methyltransferase [Treponema sp.]
MNKLFYGDNLIIMRNMSAESIDLIYLDPPFNSNRNYNLLYKNTTGLPIPEQIEAFCDTWEPDYEKSETAADIPNIMRNYGIQNDAVQFWYYLTLALKSTNPKLLAYLVYMTVRLIEMYRILKQSGSMYLHCDPNASHYLKIIMDSIFSEKNFKNELIWSYHRWPAKAKRFQRMHDIILYYTKTEEFTFNQLYQEPTESSKKRWAGKTQRVTFDGHGKRLPTIEEESDSPGVPMNDVWRIPIIAPSSKERLGYPTQKPLALLERIIKASTQENDVVFDPFCGCGTTIEASIKNNRQWIGCDIAIHSIKLIQNMRIQKYGLNEPVDYEIEGIPQSVEQARYLFEQDPFQFQYWAVERTGGFCSNKKTADKGIDGRLYFETGKTLCNMVLSVKGGSIKPADIRDLRGVLEREQGTELAGFICLKEPTKAMIQEADAAGFYAYQGIKYPRIQMLTVQDIFKGKTWRCPSAVKTARKDKGQAHFAL